MDEAGKLPGLRGQLRLATARAHDDLETVMDVLDLSNAADYVRFLQIQYGARMGMERWLDTRAPIEGFALPPHTCDLIAADLAELGAPAPASFPQFTLSDAGANTDGSTMGVAWVLAGSNLGNRMMAAQLARRDALPRASRFLNDDCSAAYWKGIQPRITAPVSAPSAHAAMQAAHAAFDHFAHVAQTHIRKAAA